MLLIIVHVSTSFSAGQAREFPDPYPDLFPDFPSTEYLSLPPGFDQELEQCWFSLRATTACVSQIYAIYSNNTKIDSLSPKCCKTINRLNNNCFGKMMFNPLFIPYLRSYCIHINEPTSTNPKIGTNPTSPIPKIATDTNKGTNSEIAPQFFAPWLGPDYMKCLSSLRSVEGCIGEVIGSLISFQFRLPGRACCKAVTEISENCWSKLLPLNPFMNPLLKGYCANIVQVAPGPTKQI
ncbi:Prolamin-like domain [Macleaya cordata]|uniref:Prolamin-like domain n=1 Tax=Macleaya cordata TaxID=56857 RepID=A0A200R913_MACCD|nr:Prolamin-like domain [Macleaya cordata]